MKSFKGSLKIPATQDVIDAVFAVDDENLVVSTGDEALGSWPLHEVRLDDMGSEIRMVLDGENVVADIVDRDSFLSAMAPPGRRRGRRKKPRSDRTRPRAKRTRPEPQPKPEPPAPPPRVEHSAPSPTPDPEPQPVPRRRKKRQMPDVVGAIRKAIDPEFWRDLLANETTLWVIASATVMIVVGLAFFATAGLGTILILLGMVALVIAGLAVTEDLTALAWIPGNLSETTLVLAGVSSLALGGLLILIG